ncbi:MAG: tetratricopeptide repeat protein [Acidobacteriota bacterium]
MAGRDDVLAELAARLRSAEGSLAAVRGESGAGKTRVAQALATLARQRGALVLAGACQPGDEGGPLHPLRPLLDLLAGRLSGRPREDVHRVLGFHARAIGPFHPPLAEIFDALAIAPLEELPPEAALLRLFGVLAAAFGAFAGRRNALYVLDDVQWADDLTLGFLRYVLRTGRLAQLPIFVCATYRPEEVSAALGSLLEEPACASVALPLLRPGDVASIAADMLALRPAPPDLIDVLWGRTEGNPFFVAEYLRASVASGVLARDARGTWRLARDGSAPLGQLPEPGSLRVLVEDRLGRLTAEARRLVSVASVLSREIQPEVLAAVSGQAAADPAMTRVLHELVARQVMEETDSGNLRFVHDKIREIARDAMTPESIGSFHRAAAGAMVDAAGSSGERAAVRALRWERCGERARALPLYLEAADDARRQFDLSEAERHYRSYLRLAGEPTEETVGVRIALVDGVYLSTARASRALEELGTALDEARAIGSLGLVAVALKHLGHTYGLLGRLGEAEASLAEAVAIHRSRDDTRGEASCLVELGRIAYCRGRLPEARARFEAAGRISSAGGDRRREASALSELSMVLDRLGLGEAADEAGNRALRIMGEFGSRADIAVSLNAIGLDLHGRGRPGEARSAYEHALEIVRTVGDRVMESAVLSNLAILLWEGPDRSLARRPFEDAVQIARETGDPGRLGIVLRNLAQFRADTGAPLEEVRPFFEEALATQRRAGRDIDVASTLAAYASVIRGSGGPIEEASQLLAEAEGAMERIGMNPLRVQAMCERGHLLLALGKDAREILEGARARAAELGSIPRDVHDALARLSDAVAAQERGGSRARRAPGRNALTSGRVQKIFPGFRMPPGSKAALTRRISATVSSPRSLSRCPRPTSPTPCSPEMAPPSDAMNP